MRKVRLIALSLLLCAFSASGTGIITWGPASLSDDNGGLFLIGVTTSASGPQYTINLPNFFLNNFAFSSGEVDVGISAHSTLADIIGVMFTYTGAFTGQGGASYIDSAGILTHGPTAFNSTLIVDTINFAPTNNINILAFLTIFDNGGSAAISQIRFNIIQRVATVPEPATIVLLGLGIFAMLWMTTRRRRLRA